MPILLGGGERLFDHLDGGPEGYECVEFVSSPAIAHVRLARTTKRWCDDAVMAITGTHALLYTSEPEAVRGLFRDVFGWKHVDAGEGWLIFALPPAELGIHPAEGPTFQSSVRHQLS
ncbi:MAG: hypothetical protein ACRDZS_09485, partial [Acidimicrobiales bacterium]